MLCRTVAGKLRNAYDQVAHQLQQYDTVVSHQRAHVGITGEEFHTMAPKDWLEDACIKKKNKKHVHRPVAGVQLVLLQMQYW